MKKSNYSHILKTEQFICSCCGIHFLLFADRIKRYTYKQQTPGGTAYYCRYNCWVKKDVKEDAN